MFKNDVVRHDRIRILKQINKQALSKAGLDFQQQRFHTDTFGDGYDEDDQSPNVLMI